MAVDITLSLPDDLVRDAREFGLLETEFIADVLQRELDARVNALVNEEIHAYRETKSSTA